MGEGTELGNGRYVLQHRLGTGGAATVWLADDTVLERSVAVKVLSEALATDENWLARFKREARLAASLNHANLVAIYDFDAEPERPYIVMEHMPGGSLWDLMQSGDATDPEHLARDVLSALEAIHAAGIIHRDIKPGNVLFDADQTACLTDFGVARPEDATSLTQTGHIPGTGKYMAPELWAGHPADERTDLYAAGVLLRQATGRDAPAALAGLIASLTADEAQERPDNATAALAALGPAEETPSVPFASEERTQALPPDESPTPVTPVPAPTPDPAPRVPVTHGKDHTHRRAAIAGIAILAIVAAVAIAQAVGGGDDTGGGSPASGQQANAQGSGESDGGGSSSGSGSGSGSDSGSQSDPPTETVDPVALDSEGRALIDAGDPESAIPILQQAVDYYPKDSRDINYAYSLYNLGEALLLAGRPEEAIPYLEKRMTFDDGQLDTVQATLDEALAAAGETSGESSESSSSGKGKVPPGQAKKD